MSLNLLGVDANEGEECVICKCHLSKEATYRLPECHHTFHTACVVAWFRAGDCRCPVCRNMGINSHGESGNTFMTRGFAKNNPRLKEIAAYAKKNPKSCPKYVEGLLKKNAKLTEEVREARAEHREFVQSLKEKEVNYEEAHRKKTKLRRAIWEKERRMYRCQREILQIPIVPLIIPSFVLMD